MLRFPMKLTGLEEYFLRTDQTDFPSSFMVRLEFSKKLEREFTEKAVARTSHRNLLGTCRVSVTNRAKPVWVKCADRLAVEWSESPIEKGVFPCRDIDITRHLPIRILGYDGKDDTNGGILAFVIHHVAFDGLGFQQWLNDWIACYRCLERSGNLDEPQLRELDEDILSIRCRPALTWSKQLRILHGQWKSIRATFQVLKRKAIPLVPVRQMASPKTAGPPSYLVTKFSEGETKKLKQVARGMGSRANSLVARDLMVVMNRWRETNNITTEGTHFRLMVPINERRREHRKMPACNHCTMINLDRKSKEIENENELLASVDQEMGVIEKYRLSLNFWRILSVFRNLPGGLDRFLDADKVSATALFTNVGRVAKNVSQTAFDSAGPLAITDFTALAPLNRGLVASISMYYFHKELNLSLQYDDQSMTRDAAESFFEALQEKLKDTLESPST